MTFENVFPPLREALAARGYAAPTAVQAAILAPEVAGRDLIVSARTGSGKTVAFGLAMAPDLLDEAGRIRPAATPRALVIAPTRELALQVSSELGWLYEPTGASVATCVGGMNIGRERRRLAQGADIVVGTPGRLRDHLEQRALNLSALDVAVLDEADEMLDMGFREDLEALLDATPEGRRTLLFSATMPRPIVALASRYQQDALRLSTVGEERGHGDIAYRAMPIVPGDALPAVVNLLRYYDAETAILFCGTREGVRQLHADLTARGFAAVALSGEHSQAERNNALQALRDGRARVCVATDVAARGIDLPGLSLVVHVELPRDAETMQHRSGRTGRAGHKGTAVLLVPMSRRRRVEGMLRGARVEAEWTSPPDADAIREADRERLIARLSAPAETDEEDRAIAARLLQERSAEDLAAALVHAQRALLPQAEAVRDINAPRPPRVPREGFEGSAWFRLDVGRMHQADPRWLLPLLCRRGDVGRSDIGAIRIARNETLVEVAQGSANRFLTAFQRSTRGEGEDSIAILPVDGTPREAARHNKRGGRPDNAHHAAPWADAHDDRAAPRGRPGGRRNDDWNDAPQRDERPRSFDRSFDEAPARRFAAKPHGAPGFGRVSNGPKGAKGPRPYRAATPGGKPGRDGGDAPRHKTPNTHKPAAHKGGRRDRIG